MVIFGHLGNEFEKEVAKLNHKSKLSLLKNSLMLFGGN